MIKPVPSADNKNCKVEKAFVPTAVIIAPVSPAVPVYKTVAATI